MENLANVAKPFSSGVFVSFTVQPRNTQWIEEGTDSHRSCHCQTGVGNRIKFQKMARSEKAFWWMRFPQWDKRLWEAAFSNRPVWASAISLSASSCSTEIWTLSVCFESWKKGQKIGTGWQAPPKLIAKLRGERCELDLLSAPWPFPFGLFARGSRPRTTTVKFRRPKG